MNTVALAWELMAYGLIGVFAVLVLFFFMIKLLMKIFPGK